MRQIYNVTSYSTESEWWDRVKQLMSLHFYLHFYATLNHGHSFSTVVNWEDSWPLSVLCLRSAGVEVSTRRSLSPRLCPTARPWP